MKTLYLMRHGETLFNRLHKKQGWCDSPLTELGRKQALVARQYFQEQAIQFDGAFCSTAERASDTLELITDQPYTRMKGLKEWHFGRFEGQDEFLNPVQPYEDFFLQYGGESEDQVQARLNQTLLEIMRRTSGEQILVVSHATAMRAFMRLWQHTSEFAPLERLSNCGILRFAYEGDPEAFILQEIVEHDFSGLG